MDLIHATLKKRGVTNAKITRVASQSVLQNEIDKAEGSDHFNVIRDDDGTARTALRLNYDEQGREVPTELLWCTESRIKDIKGLVDTIADDLYERSLERLLQKYGRSPR